MFDLNVPISSSFLGVNNSKKPAKGKQPAVNNVLRYTSAQLAVLETRVDLLVHCACSVIQLYDHD